MTCVAVMVVPVVVPRTRTVWPVVMALAEVEAEVVPFWYVVDGASLTVTAWPAGVVSVKLDVDALLTVPAVPPSAGPDRALDPPPADPEAMGPAPDPEPPGAAADPEPLGVAAGGPLLEPGC
jgi:hypothetical protein